MSHPGDVHVANRKNGMRKYMETKISTSWKRDEVHSKSQ